MPNSPLVECVPNFSDGRDPAVLDAIGNAILSVPGAQLLDVHRDADHNRSVFTFVAPPGMIVEAAVAAVRCAAERIDLRAHHGEHPRMGAADVIPFVPLRGTSLEDCVRLARDCGQRIGNELGIPVYLYEAAATRPDRRNLADVRRPRFEGLPALIATDPAWAPDFGPKAVHPMAGASAVGARTVLVAYNVWLQTPDVAVAKSIAHAVRERDGGLPGVKALGLFIQGAGLAQVSMNLCDPGRTSMQEAYEAVAREASARRVKISHSELVGMVSERFFDSGWIPSLKLKGFRVTQIIERNLP
jgi:glutamate formiminotransferase